MKFFRITNGDIVTSIRPMIGTPGIKALRVYDATNKCYCFEERAYRGSLYAIKEQLKQDSAVCLRNQIGAALKGCEPQEEETSIFDVLKGWLP